MSRIFLAGFDSVVRFIVANSFALLIPTIALLYGIGDFYGWWDRILGRSDLERALERLASPKGFPVAYIYFNDPDFPRLEKFISARSGNADVRKRSHAGIRPTLITRAGGGEIKIPTPPDWPSAMLVPGESPILYSYDATLPNKHGTDIVMASTLNEVRNWVGRHRDTERMLMNIVFISVLSIALIAYERRR